MNDKSKSGWIVGNTQYLKKREERRVKRRIGSSLVFLSCLARLCCFELPWYNTIWPHHNQIRLCVSLKTLLYFQTSVHIEADSHSC